MAPLTQRGFFMSIQSDAGQFIDLTLTPPQNDFLQLSCKHPAFVAGFGTGKSQTMAVSSVLDASEGGSDATIAILEPTFDLCKLIAVPRIEQILSELGIRFKTVGNKEIYTSHGGIGDFLFRSMDNPARLVGWEAFRIHCDEIDTLKKEAAKGVWRAAIARCRQSPKEYVPFDFLPDDRPLNRVSAYCTPEGFNFLYGRWAKDKERSRKAGYLMIQAATSSNPFLPVDYLDALRASYDPQRFEAYAKGQFVNLKSGTVYKNFKRELNDTDVEIIPGETLIVGQDFNVNKMATVIYVERYGEDGLAELHAVDERHNGIDTPDVIRWLVEKYQNPGNGYIHPIEVYPDASGGNTSSKNASMSDLSMLMSAGFDVYCGQANPAVKDRVISANTLFCNAVGRRRLFVSSKRCPQFVECLEQQIYDDKGKPDKEAGKDHMNDAGTYPVVYKFPVVHNGTISANNIEWVR